VLSEKKFRLLPQKLRHKQAAELLRIYVETSDLKALHTYRKCESLLSLSQTPLDFPSLSDRFHDHIKAAGLTLKEHQFLIQKTDTPSNTPYLPIDIYLENLRSAHNVGSILRTVEAFRLGFVYFSDKTPSATHPKVLSTAMGCAGAVPSETLFCLGELKRPLIAVETAIEAPPFFEFSFPTTFSLLLGNEAYGLKEQTLAKADQVIRIPLQGSKNSLNVSCAFAIIAAEIRRQFSLKTPS